MILSETATVATSLTIASLKQLSSAQQQCLRDCHAERLCCTQINHEIESRRLLNGKIARCGHRLRCQQHDVPTLNPTELLKLRSHQRQEKTPLPREYVARKPTRRAVVLCARRLADDPSRAPPENATKVRRFIAK